MADPKKTLYHSELVSMGKIIIDVTSDVIPSRHKRGTFIVMLTVNGFARTYQIENPGIQALFTTPQSRKGQRLTVQASGSREAAVLEILTAAYTPVSAAAQAQSQPAQPASAPQPQAQPAQAQPQQQATQPQPQPAQSAPGASQQQSAPAQPPNPQPNGNIFKGGLIRLMNLELHCQIAARRVADELFTKRDIKLTEEQVMASAGRLYISLERSNLVVHLPPDHLIDIVVPAKPQPAQQPQDKGAA